MQNTYTGGCHCGAVRFRVTTDLAGILDCNCSICAKKGFLHLIVEPEQFELLTDRAALSTYTFGTGAAKHMFCATCGMHPFYVPRSHPDKIDVNVRCIEALDLGNLQITPYDGQNWEQARADLG